MNSRIEAILIVEDEEMDVEFLQRAFVKAGSSFPVRAVTNGEEAMAYLCGMKPFGDRAAFPFPRLVITDLKMPRMGGLQLLQWMQTQREFRGLPRIVLTSSTAQSDVNAAFQFGAAAYIVKPVEYRELERIAKIIVDYWRLSLLPRWEA